MTNTDTTREVLLELALVAHTDASLRERIIEGSYAAVADDPFASRKQRRRSRRLRKAFNRLTSDEREALAKDVAMSVKGWIVYNAFSRRGHR